MFAQYFRIPISWGELIKRTAREVRDDNCLGLAAQLGFYFFLALFPALLFLVSLIGLLPIGNIIDEALRNLRAVAPAEVVAIVRQQFENLASGGASGKLLTLGIVGALWSSSAAMMAIIDTLNRAYDIAERRPWWKARLVAIFLTLVLSVFITVSLSLLLAGPTLLSWLGAAADHEGPGRLLWRIVHWPLAGLLVVLAIDLIYYVAPNRKTAWIWVTPGSLLATVLWIATSLGFRLYVTDIGSYNATYGTIGAIIVLMLWLYLSGLSILIGAELNAEIDHALAAAKKDAGGG